MMYLTIFGILLMLFTAWVVSLAVPFLPLFPIIWASVGFLILAEFLFLWMVGMLISHRSIKGTPVTLSFLAFPGIYLLCSCAIVPFAFAFLTYTPLLLCHFSLLLVLTGLGFAMLGTADKSKAEAQIRNRKRFEIRQNAAALNRCVTTLQRLGKEYATEELILVAERMSYAPESNDSADCLACDTKIEELISQLEGCVSQYESGTVGQAGEIARLTGRLAAALDERKLILSK